MKTAVIANPNSSAGKTGRRWEELSARLESRLGPVETALTERPGHATDLARGLLLRGFDRIVGVGGDGTFNEIANGFIENGRPVRPGACLGLVPAGTGGDLRRTLGMSANVDEAIEILAGGATLTIDLGRISFVNHQGEARSRYFINLTSFGMGGEVSARAKNGFMVFGGKAAFLWATLKVFAIYRGKKVELELDGREAGSFSVLNVAIGNGPFHGGGMYVCPRARLDDGQMEVTVIDDLSLFTLARDVKYLYDGNIYDHPKVRHFRAKHIVASSPEATRIEVDGEPLGRLPAEVSVLPGAMRVIVAENSPLLA